MKKKTLRYAFRATLPVLAGYLVLGIGFGILLYDAGFSCWWAILMSVTIYAGAMQYVGVNLLAAAVSLPTAALMTLGVNARHLFYGVSMVEKYRNMGRARPYLAFSLTDETYSLVCDARLPGEIDPKGYYFWVSLLDQVYWIVGSFLGSLLGSTLRMDTAGVDFSMTALFVVIFLDQWEKSEVHTPALIGGAAAVLCLLIFGPDRFLIPAMALIVAGLFAGKPWIEGGNGCDESDARAFAGFDHGGGDGALRFLPFVLFSKGTPKAVLYLGKVLPAATMAMLVVYCLRNVSFSESPHGVPEAASILLTAALYKWRHNTLLAILGGTISYMIFIRLL